MTTDFEWKEEYSVDVPLLDNQHKYMFEQGKKISHLQPEQTKKLVVDLYRYIMQHFTAEEAHMKEIEFPELEEHRRLHENIIDQLNQMTTGFEPSERNTLKLKLFIFNWLQTHILKHDKKYFEFVNR
ncbi:MAG: bacteriohemerythrin [Deltaproteobacteria bacterium]|nr:bacteriohemerythrin [Deltaproteobacteria bacterium]MBN2672232.1 bacteriohemerythrin [Deltaproteobacteria bacterium]